MFFSQRRCPWRRIGVRRAHLDLEESGGPTKTSPLHQAAVRGHEHVASVRGHAGLVKKNSLLLLEHQADVSARGTAGRPPLQYAAGKGHEAAARLLIEHQADVWAKDNNEATALFFAASQGHQTVARLFIEHQADVSAKKNDESLLITRTA